MIPSLTTLRCICSSKACPLRLLYRSTMPGALTLRLLSKLPKVLPLHWEWLENSITSLPNLSRRKGRKSPLVQLTPVQDPALGSSPWTWVRRMGNVSVTIVVNQGIMRSNVLIRRKNANKVRTTIFRVFLCLRSLIRLTGWLLWKTQLPRLLMS